VSAGSTRHGFADKAIFMKISKASRSTAIGPGQPPIVSLPAIGALDPRVEILFWVGLAMSVLGILKDFEYSLESIDTHMGSWATNTAANISADTLSSVNT
jgi:hypothetical protein